MYIPLIIDISKIIRTLSFNIIKKVCKSFSFLIYKEKLNKDRSDNRRKAPYRQVGHNRYICNESDSARESDDNYSESESDDNYSESESDDTYKATFTHIISDVFNNFIFSNDNITDKYPKNIKLYISLKNNFNYKLNNELLNFFTKYNINCDSAVHVVKANNIQEYIEECIENHNSEGPPYYFTFD